MVLKNRREFSPVTHAHKISFLTRLPADITVTGHRFPVFGPSTGNPNPNLKETKKKKKFLRIISVVTI